MDILAGLNPPQREAVQTPGGPLLILAGPGSGKTRVIAHRIAYLIHRGVRPGQIMAVTFTNKAAQEMRERLYGLLGRGVEGLTLGTFHAICARILRRDGASIGLASNFVIYDDDDQINLIKQAMQELGIEPKRFTPRALQSTIDAAKSQLLRVEDLAGERRSYAEEVTYRLYERYQQLLRQSQALDFDDLLMQAVYLFREHREVLEKYQDRYLHLLIDEFQDTNIAQYALARLLAGKHRNICVVGDPDQAIYSWRYADIRNILSFEKDYPEARVVYLEQNYRSTCNILEAASSVIASNVQRKPKRLWTESEEGTPLIAMEAYTEQEEAQFVTREVEKLLAQGIRAGECAVMYRTNAQSRALEETFVRYGLPYKLVGATRFYERREIKDVIAYLRLLHNPQDSISLSRIINVPGRGIGQKTLAELSQMAQSRGLPLYEVLKEVAEQKSTVSLSARSAQALASFYKMVEEVRAASREMSMPDLLDLLLERTGYRQYVEADEDGEERWDNIMELRTVAQGHKDLASFLEGVALVSDVDNLDEKAEGVTLITLHQAKGLEFGIVFITGMEEGVLPHFRSFGDQAQMEEERRLCYVGMTRAKKRLYLLRAYRRTLGGMSNANPPSRYILDIPTHLVSRPLPGEEVAEIVPKTLPPELKPGEHVRHAAFGEGVVVNTQPAPDDQEVTVAFRGLGVKKLLLSLAKLQRIEGE